jgi:hypothetical protein
MGPYLLFDCWVWNRLFKTVSVWLGYIQFRPQLQPKTPTDPGVPVEDLPKGLTSMGNRFIIDLIFDSTGPGTND